MAFRSTTARPLTRKANDRTYTMGVALEPCSMPQTRRHNFEIGPDDIEIGMGIHGEPGVVAREDDDRRRDRRRGHRPYFFGDEAGSGGSRRRAGQFVRRDAADGALHSVPARGAAAGAKGIAIEANWVGHYCTSLDMVGASISMLHLDDELTDTVEPSLRRCRSENYVNTAIGEEMARSMEDSNDVRARHEASGRMFHDISAQSIGRERSADDRSTARSATPTTASPCRSASMR